MDGDGRAGLFPYSEDVHGSPIAKRSTLSEQPNTSIIQGNRRLRVLLQDQTSSYSPSDLPNIFYRPPVAIQPNDNDIEAVVKETLERRPSSSPDPLSREWILEPWSPVETSQIISPAVPAYSEQTNLCPLFAPGCNCTALGGHEFCRFLRGELKGADDADKFGRSMAGYISSPLQISDPWDVLESHDDPSSPFTAQQSELCDEGAGAFFPLVERRARRTYSDPGVLELTAPTIHHTSSPYVSSRELPLSYSHVNPRPTAAKRGEATALPPGPYGCAKYSSSVSTKENIKRASGFTQRPGPPKSRLGKRGLERRPQTSHGSKQLRKKSKPLSKSNYREDEKAWVLHYLKEEISGRNFTESKWENISRELARRGLRRSRNSIKAWWSRYGRQETGFDERQNPSGRRLVTSKQDPEDRKKMRRLKKQVKQEAGLEGSR
ncbi:MAG: hypothetical protein Q9171_001256 [Xanthocarpia ochracea]